MTTEVNVAFSTADEEAIIACMATPQSTALFPYQGKVSTSDPRYATFYDAYPALQPMMPAPNS
ncbi:hypothetical protein ABWH74_003098 [Burkholderia vietnamiensis]